MLNLMCPDVSDMVTLRPSTKRSRSEIRCSFMSFQPDVARELRAKAHPLFDMLLGQRLQWLFLGNGAELTRFITCERATRWCVQERNDVWAVVGYGVHISQGTPLRDRCERAFPYAACAGQRASQCPTGQLRSATVPPTPPYRSVHLRHDPALACLLRQRDNMNCYFRVSTEPKELSQSD
jgi:hypothetical protein